MDTVLIVVWTSLGVMVYPLWLSVAWKLQLSTVLMHPHIAPRHFLTWGKRFSTKFIETRLHVDNPRAGRYNVRSFLKL